MGQKVNPIGLRIGVIKDWESKWYANKKEVADLLQEDINIMKNFQQDVKTKKVQTIMEFLKLKSKEQRQKLC